ncbi:MAG: arginase [Bryobacteraceae bacterium]|nr:arginase [Bryobacteraceae bacterium]MDW8378980.1 arginase [Bryobacterales bacterium]
MPFSRIAVIGAPLDLGAGRRGVDMGPSAIRVANLDARLESLGYEVEDLGNVEVKQAESLPRGRQDARYLPEIASTCRKLAAMVEKAAAAGQLPLVLGGDHSLAIGTVSGVSRHFRTKKRNLGLIWIDAHADMNTPKTSPTGNIHGMPLACLIGKGPEELTHLYRYAPKVDPKNVALVGLRSVDPLEKTHVKESGVRAFTMRDIDERGLRSVMEEAVEIACAGTAGFHLSFDMDSLDPQFAPGVGTPVRGGITYREAHLAMEIVNDSQKMVSMEFVEVNPVIDEVNRTAELAVELAMSALGKRIL